MINGPELEHWLLERKQSIMRIRYMFEQTKDKH